MDPKLSKKELAKVAVLAGVDPRTVLGVVHGTRRSWTDTHHRVVEALDVFGRVDLVEAMAEAEKRK